MIYSDGAATDKYGFLLICPRCGDKEIPRQARKCGVCGEKKLNVCLPKEKNVLSHVNAPNARYCEVCGAETVLFHSGKLLPWQDAKDELSVASAMRFSESSPDLPF